MDPGLLGKQCLNNDCPDYEKETTGGAPPPQWISVKDRLPEDDGMKIVFAVSKKGLGSVNRAWYDGFWHGSGSMAGITHWMPLPEPPKEGEDDGRTDES